MTNEEAIKIIQGISHWEYWQNDTLEAFIFAIKALEERPEDDNGVHEIEHPLQMIRNGFSQHDCEGHWKCPKCNKDYGDWGFFNKGLKGWNTFICECGTNLIVPS